MITIQHLGKTFKSVTGVVRAVDGVNLEVRDKEFFVLLGLSGSGKTTLLRCVAGLERPDAGEIILQGQTVSSAEQGIFAPPEQRGIGMVFQSYAVWPHMNVFDNVAFPLTDGKKKYSRSEIQRRVMGALELVQLSGLEARPAPFLSGGQQQRVALARALAVEPKVLLMDEPLSNLDARLRETVRDEIKGLSQRLGITVFYVTHDQVEAMAIADNIAVMSHGKVLQIGRPQDLYDSPVNRNVAEFLGSINELAGRVENNGHVRTELGIVACGAQVGQLRGEVVVAIRPSDIFLSTKPTGVVNEFSARLLSQLFLGEIIAYDVVAGEMRLCCKSSNADPSIKPGSDLFISLPADKIKVFSKQV